MSKNYEVFQSETGAGGVIKTWTKGVAFENEAREQLKNIASLPFIHKWAAAMTDIHVGIGATIGSVIPTKSPIIPAAVGVDIGCGMIAQKLSLKANDLPDNLTAIRHQIELDVPVGFIVRGLDNPESFASCSHGAGRLMSRTAARAKISLEEHKAATASVGCRKDAGVIDESPAAYKDIDAVMRAQSDLVEIVHTLKQVVCVNG